MGTAQPDETGLLARHLGVSDFTVSTTWKKWGLQPWRSQTFKFSTDPELEAKIRDVVGLYLNPPDKAIVLCIEEKSQVQALDRTAPILPLRPGGPEKQTHDYVRHGTVRGAGGRDREGHRCLLPAAPQRRVPEVPQAGRQGLPPGEAAHRGRQLRHPQAPQRSGVAARNHGVVASFSRALTEGLTAQQSESEFDAVLDASIDSIYQASMT